MTKSMKQLNYKAVTIVKKTVKQHNFHKEIQKLKIKNHKTILY